MNLATLFTMTTLLAVNLASASANERLQKVELMNIDYSLVSANLDQNRFPAENVLVALTNVSESTLTLKIENNICPQIPGKRSCRAMPMAMFKSEFTFVDSTIDSCGVKTLTSAVTQNNGEKASLVLKDFRAMTCEIVYLADFQLILTTDNDSEKSESTILLNQKDITSMPVIHPDIPNMPILPNIPNGIQSYFTKSLVEKAGSFFDHEGLQTALSIDSNLNTLEVYTTYNPCAGQLCLAISAELIDRTLDVTSIKSNKCNEKTYYTNEVSVYDAYPEVVGAIHTYVKVEFLDSRHSICDKGKGGVYTTVTVTSRQNLGGEITIGESTATFELSSVGLEK